METTTIVAKALPLALALIMFGLGLTLKTDDFARIIKFPKPVVIGLAAQMLILPTAAFLLCKFFGLPSDLSIGLMILAASPGGATANIFSHLSHGDVALNLTLTAVNSVAAAFTLPLIVGFAISHFAGDATEIGLQFGKAIEVFAIVLIPVAIGMFVFNRSPSFARKVDRPFRAFSLLVLVVIVIGAVSKEWETLSSYFAQLGAVVLAFNLLSLGTGYFLPVWTKLPRAQAIAISMEIGIHNGTLAIYIALSVLNRFSFAVPAALYSVLMFFTAGAFTLLLNRARPNVRAIARPAVD